MRVGSSRRLRTARLLVVYLGVLLLFVFAALYLRAGFVEVGGRIAAAEAAGKTVVAAQGDVALRDIPKAYAFQTGRWFDDPHYVGEVQWYPFATPLFVALYAWATGDTLQTAYLYVPVLFATLSVGAVAAFTAYQFGAVGLLAVPLAVMLGWFWPYNGSYPVNTVASLLALFLLFCSVALQKMLQTPERVRWYWLFALGCLNGLLGLWQGSSLVVATAISLGMLLVWIARLWRTNALRASPLVLWYVLGLCLALVPLFGPQLLAYRHFEQANTARTFLADEFQGGDAFDLLVTLPFAPRGLDALLVALVAVLALFWRNWRARFGAWPLLGGYLFALVLAHAGFVLHSTTHPFLAKLSSVALVAPPHTFKEIAIFLLILLRLVALGALLQGCGVLLGALWRRVAPARGAVFGLASYGAQFALLVGAYALVFTHMPAQTMPPSRVINTQVYNFVRGVSSITAGQSAVDVRYGWGQWELMQMSPFKVEYLVSPYHRNPYVEDERERAAEAIAALNANGSEIEMLLRRYHVEYALAMPNHESALAWLCHGTEVLASPQGHRLYALGDHCDTPRMAPVATLVPVAQASNDYGVFPWNAPPTVMEVRVRGRVEGDHESCIKPEITFLNHGEKTGVANFVHHAQHTFDLRFRFVPSPNTDALATHIDVDQTCSANNERVVIENVTLGQQH